MKFWLLISKYEDKKAIVVARNETDAMQTYSGSGNDEFVVSDIIEMDLNDSRWESFCIVGEVTSIVDY